MSNENISFWNEVMFLENVFNFYYFSNYKTKLIYHLIKFKYFYKSEQN